MEERRDYGVVELSSADVHHVEAAISQANEDHPPTHEPLSAVRRLVPQPPGPRASMVPSLWLVTAFLTGGCLVGIGMMAPWWATALVGIVHIGVLVGLRVSLQDQFLALSIGVDAIVRDGHTPEIIRVSPKEMP